MTANMDDAAMTHDWLPVAHCSQVDQHEVLGVDLPDGTEICLYRLEDGYYATENKCTHGEARLSDGMIVESGLIECPLHEGTFDIRTGAAVGAPCSKPLCRYEVRVENEQLYLRR